MEADLRYMEDILEDIANLTKGAQDKVDYMKDQATQAQKTSQGKEAILPTFSHYSVDCHMCVHSGLINASL